MTSDNELRIKMAKCLGWTKVREHWELNGQIAFLNDSINHKQLPDWPNCLNAMYEAEDVNDWKYWQILADVVIGRVLYSGDLSCGVWGKVAHATARQRCIAFLRTKGVKCE